MGNDLEYTDATLVDLTEMAHVALTRYDFGKDTTVSLLNISENATFLVSEQNRPSAVLRIHRVGYHTREGIASELAWINALQCAGTVEAATPIAGRDGQHIQALPSRRGAPSRFAVLFRHLPGHEPAGADLKAWFEVLGEITARMHRQSREWVRPKGFTRHLWDADAMLGTRHLWGRWQDGMGLDEDGQKTVGAAVSVISDRLGRFGRSPEHFGLIHADLRLANLLVEGDKLQVIDFDDSGFSWFMYDFAAAVSFIEHKPEIWSLLESWIKGYRKVAPLAAADIDEIPTLVMARRILLTAWLASHREVPLARELGVRFTRQTVQLSNLYLCGPTARFEMSNEESSPDVAPSPVH